MDAVLKTINTNSNLNYMQTLKEKVQRARELWKKIRDEYPNITDMAFEFKNIPVSEIIEAEKETGGESDIVFRDDKDVLRLLVSRGGTPTIFAFSVPVKKVKTEYLIEETA